MTSSHDVSSTAHFLNELIGKAVTVTLVNCEQHGQERISGILTRVFADAILLAQHTTEQLIFNHAIAVIQEIAQSDHEFLAHLLKVQKAASHDYETFAKYVGE